MASSFHDVVIKESFQSVSENDNGTGQNTFTEHSETVTQNTSLQGDCMRVIFSEMEYLPWDNPDNIVSAEVETIFFRVQFNLLVLLCLIGGPANVINMAVFYKQGLQDRVSLCLFILSLADELSLLNAIIHHGEQLYVQFTTEDKFGPISTFLTNNHLGILFVFSFISPVLSSIIATERCLCVFNPLKFSTLLRTRTMAVIIIVLCVLVIGLYSIVVFRYRIGCVYDPESGVVLKSAIEGDVYRAHKKFIDYLDSFVFGAGLPGMEMIVVMTTTIMTIVKLRQIVVWRSGTSSSVSQREVALTKMLVGNSILFMTCVLPIFLIRVSWLFLPEVSGGRRHHNLFLCGLWVNEILFYINATFNIFIYYVMGSRYRETFWELFGKKMKQENA